MKKSPEKAIYDRTQLNRTILGALGIVLLTVLVYLPVTRCAYVWDDNVNITQNQMLRSVNGLVQTWTNVTANQQYYPLTYTSFWIEYHLWGLKPLGYHLDNMLLQALAALFLWLVLRRLSVPGAWLAAAVFAIHPLQVESVAWLAERKNTLSGVFFFAAVLAYLRYAGIGEGKRGGYFQPLVLFACALACKTSTVILPAALLIILWWKKDRVSMRDLLDLIPFFVLSAAAGYTTHWVEQNHVGAIGAAWDLPFASRFIRAGRVVEFYAQKLFWPARLIHIYPKRPIDPSSVLQYVPALIAMAVPVVLWLLRRRIGKAPLVAVLFFVIALSTTLGFFNVYFMRFSYTPHHFQYLASAGLIALAAGLLTTITCKARVVGIALPVIILTLLGISSWRQVPIFRNEETLWQDTLAKNPDAFEGYNNLAVFLIDKKKYDAAIAMCDRCLKLQPDYWEAYLNMGIAFSAKGENDAAIRSLHQALKFSPGNASANYLLAGLLAGQGKYAEAAALYDRILKNNPRNTTVHVQAGRILIRQGKKKEAAEHFRAALKIDPGMEQARIGLGLAEDKQSGNPEAQGHYKKGIRLESEGDTAGAMCEYMDAVEADPQFAQAHFNLGLIYDREGETDKAIQEYLAVLRLKPDMIEPHAKLAIAYYSRGEGENAWKEVRACRRKGYRPNSRFLKALSKLMPEP